MLQRTQVRRVCSLKSALSSPLCLCLGTGVRCAGMSPGGTRLMTIIFCSAACAASGLPLTSSHSGDSCSAPVARREMSSASKETSVASTSSQSDGLRPLTMPVVDGGDVLVSTSIGAIASIDIASGRIRWLQRMATPVSSTLSSNRVRPYQLHRPLVSGDQVISLTPDFISLW